MRRPLAVVAGFVVIATGGFVACGSDADPIAPIEVAGTWTGTTSQGRNLAFTVSDEGVTSAEFGYEMSGRCTFQTTVPITTLEPLAITDGRFGTGKTQIGLTVFLTATGEFTSSTKATGTLLIQDAPCRDTLNLTWEAVKEQPQ